MKRKAKIIRINEDNKRAICVDVDTWNGISTFIKSNPKIQKKFNYIVNLILENIKITDLYDKEDINDKATDVTAMKFFKGGSNDRIYCKEKTLDDKTFIVIICELFEKKKSQKNKQVHNNIINKIAKYEYEITK